MKRINTNHSVAVAQDGPGVRGAARGFTLVEILLAVFILGIGLIMVATIFPVGTDWTRQNVEESIASIIAENAKAIITMKYTASDLSTVTNQVVLLPNFATKVTLVDQSYAFGQTPPYPCTDTTKSLYFWTALIRKDPDNPPLGSRYRYDTYILVLKKGDVTHTFTGSPVGSLYPYATSGSLASMPVGSIGIGVNSGTVFRGYAINGSTVVNQTSIPLVTSPTQENVWYAPAADNLAANASPLVYVYETKLAF